MIDADDVVRMIDGKDWTTISEIMESALQELMGWAEENGLGVNPQKTELILFTRRYKVHLFCLKKRNISESYWTLDCPGIGVLRKG